MKTCPHLEPVERALAARRIALGDGVPSPYGPQSGIWFPCNCVFDERALRVRLQLADCVTYDENFGFAAGSDASLYLFRMQARDLGLPSRGRELADAEIEVKSQAAPAAVSW